MTEISAIAALLPTMPGVRTFPPKVLHRSKNIHKLLALTRVHPSRKITFRSAPPPGLAGHLNPGENGMGELMAKLRGAANGS
jgi:hypothetical protein